MTGAEAKYRAVLTKEDPWTSNLEGDGSTTEHPLATPTGCSSDEAWIEDASVQKSSTLKKFKGILSVRGRC